MKINKSTLLVTSVILASMLSTPAMSTEDVGYITAPSTLSVQDELELRRAIASLNHALDAADYPMYGSFFSSDGVFKSDFGDAKGPDAVATALEQVRPYITNKRHVAANLIITGSPERAVVTSYLIVFERTEALEYVGSAINVDTMERRDGAWKVVLHESTLDPATAKAIEASMSEN